MRRASRSSASPSGGGAAPTWSRPGRKGSRTFGSQLAVGGTQKRDAAAVEDRLEALAATLSSASTATSGSLYLQVQEKDLAEGLDLMMQALTQPGFAQDRLDLAKKGARQALERRNDAVTSIAQIQMPTLLFGEKFFATENTTAASLDAITRERSPRVPRRAPPPRRTSPSPSLGSSKRRRWSTSSTDGRRDRGGKDRAPEPEGARARLRADAGTLRLRQGRPAGDAPVGLPGMRRSDPDWYPAMVMNHVLGGGGFTARLMKKIRSTRASRTA
ncbi:MAG: insulinase family protein [Holophagales bacterium]|nr:insulinase family protein [Holophagales bacterium]